MNYCVGLIFNNELTRILLVKKNRGPECVKNKLNAIGGKIEKDECGDDAIIRECREETALEINNWIYFCQLQCNEGIIYFYYVVTDDIHDYEQMEDEELKIYNLEFDQEIDDRMNLWYQNHSRVANLDWLIPMALNHYKKLDPTKSFTVIENY
jgi:8-oxo-dGTP pyrophosphatase MutT (NUDIX family)